MNHQKIKISIGVIGDNFTGKTSILNVFNNNNFENNISPTNDIYSIKKIIKKNNENINIYLIDIPEYEFYRIKFLNIIKHLLGLIFVYSITSKLSFENCQKWIKNFKHNKFNNIPLILIGNKCDLIEKREVLKEEGEKFAKEYNFNFFESSALDNINIQEPINKLIDIILSQIGNNLHIKNINLNSKSFKILILGDKFTGKSNIKNNINTNYTLPLNNYRISINIDLKEINFESKERDDEIKKVSGIILCYSLNNINSFNKLKEWIITSDLNEKGQFFVPKLLIGNLIENKTINISFDEIKNLSRDYFLQNYENFDKETFNDIFQNFIYEMILYNKENKINPKKYTITKNNEKFIFKSIYLNNISLNDNIECFGKIIYDIWNKEKYKGFIKNGKREKKGIKNYPNNLTYIGNWLNDKKSGYGIIKYGEKKKNSNLLENDKNKNSIEFTFNKKYKNNFENKLLESNRYNFENNSIIFKGYFKNNKKEGYGESYEKKGDIYKGNWENSMKNGKGKMEYKIGKYINKNINIICKIYNGEWKNDKWNGKGIITLEDGRIIEGYFINDNIDISKNSKITYKNGNIYYGLINNDYNKNGIGELKFYNGNIYDGNWKNDLKNGKGKYYYTNESIFEGEWENDKIINGIFYSDKSDYEIIKKKKNEVENENLEEVFKKRLIKGIIYGGHFINESLNGKGIYIIPNEYCYIGEFINNKKNGIGRIINIDGIIYTGEWKDDKKEGFGNIIYLNKDNYIGNWKNDKIEGKGIYMFQNGKFIEGNQNFTNNDWNKLIFEIKKLENLLRNSNNEIKTKTKKKSNNKIKPILKCKIR